MLAPDSTSWPIVISLYLLIHSCHTFKNILCRYLEFLYYIPYMNYLLLTDVFCPFHRAPMVMYQPTTPTVCISHTFVVSQHQTIKFMINHEIISNC